MSSNKESGFTLLEVLMALAILAIAGMSVLTMTSEIVRNTPIIEQRPLAAIVADNLMVDLYLEPEKVTHSWQQRMVTMADKEWQVRFRSVPTMMANFQAMEVEVRAPDDQGIVLASLKSYRDKP